MKCPACKSMMIVVEHEQIELDYCPECAGVWFDSGELELLLDTMQLQRSALALDTILTSPEVKTREKKRKCPICGHKMKKATVGHDPEVLIDACPRGDGLWFDAGEVGQLITQSSPGGEPDSQGRIIHFLGEVFQVKG
ncbi:MAG: zf-TFIIB domain-containing protein [Dehalococcoidia bacterium]